MWKNWKEPVSLLRKDARVTDIIMALGVAVLFSYFFYRSLWVLPFMLPVSFIYLYLSMLEQRRKRLQRERDQFKECILSVSASLRAGYAVEGAFLESRQDMAMLYGEGSYVVRELRLLEHGLKNREPLEELLQEWGGRSDIEEIGEFADVLSIGKRGGGSIQDIIDATSRIISQKLQVAEELETLLANKMLEQKVMNAMPFVVVFYLEWSTPGYFDMLYEGIAGRLIMTGCMVAYMASYWFSRTILQKIYE